MSFDELIQLALTQELTGWDFSWLNARTQEDPLPWDYRTIVLDRLRSSCGENSPHAMLDMDTGGGEFLSSLAPYPPVAWATEGFSPNVLLARARLEPLGVQIADVSADPDMLPFPDEYFDLVINRHGSINVSEIKRVLRFGGRFLTQQVGGQNCLDLNRALQDDVEYEYANWTLDVAVRQFEENGMRVLHAQDAYPGWTFTDIAGAIFYLKAIPWQISDFNVDKYRDRLYIMHQQIELTGGFTVREHRFFLEIEK